MVNRRVKAEYDSVVQKLCGYYAARLLILRDSDTIYEGGFIARIAMRESCSRTTCQFDNAVLWLIE